MAGKGFKWSKTVDIKKYYANIGDINWSKKKENNKKGKKTKNEK